MTFPASLLPVGEQSSFAGGAAEACRGRGAAVEGGWIPPGRSKEGSVECPAGVCVGGRDRGIPVEAGGEWIREGSTVLKSALQRLGAETLTLSQGWPGGTCPHRKRPGGSSELNPESSRKPLKVFLPRGD